MQTPGPGNLDSCSRRESTVRRVRRRVGAPPPEPRHGTCCQTPRIRGGGRHMDSDGHVVLVVEDDEGIRSLVVDFLRDEQIRAEEARDGVEALGLVEAYRPLSRR